MLATTSARPVEYIAPADRYAVVPGAPTDGGGDDDGGALTVPSGIPIPPDALGSSPKRQRL
eukprot:262286-Chlamydomonas_euryale.AAC.1